MLRCTVHLPCRPMGASLCFFKQKNLTYRFPGATTRRVGPASAPRLPEATSHGPAADTHRGTYGIRVSHARSQEGFSRFGAEDEDADGPEEEGGERPEDEAVAVAAIAASRILTKPSSLTSLAWNWGLQANFAFRWTTFVKPRASEYQSLWARASTAAAARSEMSTGLQLSGRIRAERPQRCWNLRYASLRSPTNSTSDPDQRPSTSSTIE